MDKKIWIPIGGLIIIVCFFLPWVRACGIDVSGMQLSSDKDIGDPSIWLILICGIAIVSGYFFIQHKTKVIAIVSSIVGLFLLIWKIIVPFSKGEAREVGLSIQIGGIGTILGFILSLIGGTAKEIKKEPEQKTPVNLDDPLSKT